MLRKNNVTVGATLALLLGLLAPPAMGQDELTIQQQYDAAFLEMYQDIGDLDKTFHFAELAVATGDLEGAFIAIAATDDRAVNEAVTKEATERNTPLNVVDVTDLCTFIAPSVIRRGPVTLAISTGGMGPALARKLRQELEGNEALAFADMAEIVADVRAELKARKLTVDPEGWQAALNTEVLGLYQSGQPAQARERMIELLETWNDRAQARVS